MSRKIHFLGVGGSGISGVAHLAEKMGYRVSGCDLEENTAYGSNIFKGHDPKHVEDADLVVTTPAVFFQNGSGQNNDNQEVLLARKKGILITWQEFVGKYLARGRKTICIAGTHGKSTTTAMVGQLLINAGLDPMVVIGANVPAWGGNYRYGKGKYLVIEADEFYDNFLYYNPEIIILNNIEFDHPDYFKNMNEVYSSFEKFVGKLTRQKVLIINEDSDGVMKLLNLMGKEKLEAINLFTYALSKTEHTKASFTIGGTEYKVGVPGKHNLSNSLGVVTISAILKIDRKILQRTLENFAGISRRLELITDRGGIKVYDDYAHHPTAIKASLEALRERYPDQRIIAVDEPHGYMRTKALLENYNGVLDAADKVYIGPIFKARDKVDPLVTPQLVAEKSKHKDAVGLNSFSHILENIGMLLIHGDIVLVMGAGKSYLWAREIAKLVRSK